MVTLDLSRISGSDQLIALVVTCASSWMEAALQDPQSPQRFIVYDEAWRTLQGAVSCWPGCNPSGSWPARLGISNMMVIHALSDLDAVGEANSQSRNLALGLLRDCSAKVIYAQEPDQIAPHLSPALGLSCAEGAELTPARVGGAAPVAGRPGTLVHRESPHPPPGPAPSFLGLRTPTPECSTLVTDDLPKARGFRTGPAADEARYLAMTEPPPTRRRRPAKTSAPSAHGQRLARMLSPEDLRIRPSWRPHAAERR